MAQTVSVQPRQLGFAFDAEEQTQTPMAKSKIVKKKKPAKVSPTAPAGKSARTKPPAAEKKTAGRRRDGTQNSCGPIRAG